MAAFGAHITDHGHAADRVADMHRLAAAGVVGHGLHRRRPALERLLAAEHVSEGADQLTGQAVPLLNTSRTILPSSSLEVAITRKRT
jgi:hypothetical protein